MKRCVASVSWSNEVESGGKCVVGSTTRSRAQPNVAPACVPNVAGGAFARCWAVSADYQGRSVRPNSGIMSCADWCAIHDNVDFAGRFVLFAGRFVLFAGRFVLLKHRLTGKRIEGSVVIPRKRESGCSRNQIVPTCSGSFERGMMAMVSAR